MTRSSTPSVSSRANSQCRCSVTRAVVAFQREPPGSSASGGTSAAPSCGEAPLAMAPESSEGSPRRLRPDTTRNRRDPGASAPQPERDQDAVELALPYQG